MNDDTKQDAEREVEDQDTNKSDGGEKKQGSTDSAAPVDDDIIIK